jgi:hypothetical protein
LKWGIPLLNAWPESGYRKGRFEACAKTLLTAI